MMLFLHLEFTFINLKIFLKCFKTLSAKLKISVTGM